MSDFIRNRKLSNLTFSQNWDEKKGSKGQEKKKFFTEASEQKKADFFSTFTYRDQVTRFRSQLSKLKNSKKCKTQASEQALQNSELRLYNQELLLLQAIRQNRNKDLLDIHQSKGKNQKQYHHLQDNQKGKQQIQTIKNRIRKEMVCLNRVLLRQYLYDKQPFKKMVMQINRSCEYGLSAQKNIKKLKIQQKQLQIKASRHNQVKAGLKIGYRRRQQRQAQEKVDKVFEGIWNDLSRSIGQKFKMQSQFHLNKKSITYRSRV